MKKLLLIITVLFSVGFHLSGQINIKPETAIRTGILYDLAMPVSGIGRFDGSTQAYPNTLRNWKQVGFELNKATLTSRQTIALSEIDKQADDYREQGMIPIGVILLNYNHLCESLVKYDDGTGGLDFGKKVIPEKLVFTSSALRSDTYNGNRIRFILPAELIFSDLEILPQAWFIDADDQRGMRQIIPGESIEVSFSTTGLKIIKLSAVKKNGDELFSSFCFNVVELITPQPTTTWPVQGTIPYLGSTTTGEAFIYLAAGHSRLTKPVVISEGIDLEDSYGWEELYHLMNQQNLLEDLRSQGFDAVILNFGQPLAYVQQNAFLMVKLLQMVNDTIDYAGELAAIGPSMGGLVLRYALRYMENNALDHNTGLFVSFDAPHQGADIPLGLQYLIYFYQDFDAAIAEMLQVLNEPAPKQMLVYHYTDPPSATAGSDPLFDALQLELSTMGDYPDMLRKIAVSNGRADAIGQPYNAGDQVISYNYSSLLTTLKGNVWSVKNNASGQIFQGKIQIPFIMNEQLNVSVFSPKPYDNAPGGYRPTFAQIDSLEAPYGDIIALHDNHCFIPIASAFDLNVNDLFFNISTDPGIMQKTPFDTIYWSSVNEEHIFISPYTAGVIYDEILNVHKKIQHLELQAGWNQVSSYLDLIVDDIPTLVMPIEDTFIALQHFDELYWPAGGINTAGTWDHKKGYVIKVNDQAGLSLQGYVPEDMTITINAGWNLIPSLSLEPENIQDLFGDNLDKIVIIKEAIGSLIFWPGASVQTLAFLEPGKSYYVKVNESFVISF